MALTKITPQMFDTSAAGHDFNIDNGTFVVDASANRVGIGTTTPSTLLDVDGTATATTFVGALTGNVTGNLTGTILTAAQTNITSLGTLTALTVDDITINGSTISDAADLTLDIGGNIILDADGGSVILRDSGTSYVTFNNSSGDVSFVNDAQDKDLIFKGYDGSSLITALTLDMSAAGAATFNSEVFIPEKLSHTGDTDTHFKFAGANDIRIVAGNVEHAAFDGTIVFNQSGADMDLRVESTGNQNMLFVDAGNNRVGIGTNSPSSLLELRKTTAGLITGGTSNTGAVLTLHHEAQWENGYTGGDWLGAVNFTTGDSSSGEGVRASVRATVDTYSNNNSLAFYTVDQGTTTLDERMRIKHNGNVGIATNNPLTPLHIVTDSSGHALTIEENSGGEAYQIGTDSYGGLAFFNSGTKVAEFADANNFQLYHSGAVKVNLNQNGASYFNGGNVGIGDTTPQALLDVGGGYGGNTTVATFAHATDAYIEIENMTTQNGAGIILTNAGTKKWTIQKDTSAHGLYIQDANTSATMTFLQGGNIGIGTTSPGFKLQFGDNTDNLGAVTTNKQIMMNIDGGYSTSASRQYKVIGFSGTTNGGTDDIKGSTYSSGEQLKNFYLGLMSDQAYFNSSRFSIIQGAQERFVITQAGNVGIGNETPDRRLYVDANVNNWTGTFRNVHASAYGLSVDLSQSTASNLYSLAVYTPSNAGLFVNNHGDVNIGNSSAPGLPLMVNANNTGKIAAFVNRSSGTQGITIGTTTGAGAGYGLHVGHQGNFGFLHPYNYAGSAFTQMQIQATDTIIKNASGTEHVNVRPGGQILGGVAGRNFGLSNGNWTTFGRLKNAQGGPIRIVLTCGHNSYGSSAEILNDTYAYGVSAGTVVSIGNSTPTSTYYVSLRKVKRVGGDYASGDGGWEYQIQRQNAYGFTVFMTVMGVGSDWTWTV